MRIPIPRMQCSAIGLAVVFLAADLAAAPLLQGGATTPPDTGGRTGGGGIDSGGNNPETTTIIDREGLVVSPDGSAVMSSAFLGQHVMAFIDTDLFTTNGDLLLKMEDALQTDARFGKNGDILLDDGRIISPTGDLIADEYILPAGSLFSSHTVGTHSHHSLRYRDGDMQGRVLLFPTTDQSGDGSFDYLHRAIRVRLEGPLLRTVAHAKLNEFTAPVAIRRDGLLVRQDGAIRRVDGTDVAAGDSGIRFLKDMDIDGTERTMNNPPVTIPDGTVLMPGGRLIDPTGRDITPATVHVDEQFPVILEGTLFRAEVHLLPAQVPHGAVIRTFGSIPMPSGGFLLSDGRRLLANNDVVAPDGTVLGKAQPSGN